MRLALDRFSDNPVIDELLCWLEADQKITSLRACAPIWRKPFIEIKYQNQNIHHMHFARESFVTHWSSAVIILQKLSDLELISEFELQVAKNESELVEQCQSALRECIDECQPMFEANLYQAFVDQFGNNCNELPNETKRNLQTARTALAAQRQVG